MNEIDWIAAGAGILLTGLYLLFTYLIAKRHRVKTDDTQQGGWLKLPKDQYKKVDTGTYRYQKPRKDGPEAITMLIESPRKEVNYRMTIEEREAFKRRVEARLTIEKEYEYDKWIPAIPSFKVPFPLQVRVIPPFAGALIRFVVVHPEHEGCEVSVYMDAKAELAPVQDFGSGEPIPYWEIYPDDEGDNQRFGLSETNEMMDAIVSSVYEQVSNKIVDGD